MQPNVLQVRNQVTLATKIIIDSNKENKKLKYEFEGKLLVDQSKLRGDRKYTKSTTKLDLHTLFYLCSLIVFKVGKNTSALPLYCIITCN